MQGGFRWVSLRLRRSLRLRLCGDFIPVSEVSGVLEGKTYEHGLHVLTRAAIHLGLRRKHDARTLQMLRHGEVADVLHTPGRDTDLEGSEAVNLHAL